MFNCCHFIFAPGEVQEEEPQHSQSSSSYISLLANYMTVDSPSQPNPQGSPQGVDKTVDHRRYPADAVSLSDTLTMDLNSDTDSDSTEPDLVIDADNFAEEDTISCDHSHSNHMTETTSRVATRANSHAKDSGLSEENTASVSHMKLNPVVSLSKVIVKSDIKDSCEGQWDQCQNGHSKPDLPLSTVQCATLSEEPSSTTDSLDLNSLPTVERFMKTTLNNHYSKGHINRHQYKRILERAINKVKAGRTTTLERVKKLVTDFVDVYMLATS